MTVSVMTTIKKIALFTTGLTFGLVAIGTIDYSVSMSNERVALEDFARCREVTATTRQSVRKIREALGLTYSDLCEEKYPEGVAVIRRVAGRSSVAERRYSECVDSGAKLSQCIIDYPEGVVLWNE
jgi:hypothetical protein